LDYPTAVLSQSQCLSSSTDDLIDSLAPSPSKKGKKKAQDVPQPVASSSDTLQDSSLPDYLVANPKPGGRESVESAIGAQKPISPHQEINKNLTGLITGYTNIVTLPNQDSDTFGL
jgi:hypothetical protein